jgi:predicted AAA+ superfamily ATPase
LVVRSSNPEQTLQAYVEMYLREEIKAEALVRKLAGFTRFLPIAGLSHGQLINTTNIARDAGVNRTTVNGHLEILEDTLLSFRVPAFESGLRVREKKHPKLYWCDPGLARTVAHRRGEVSFQERGILLEGIVATILKAYQSYSDICDEISYWSPADSTQTEVDFVLTRGEEYVGIEVKATEIVGPHHIKGLKAIRDLKRLRRRVIVYLGDRIMRTDDGIDILPINNLDELLQSEDFWTDREV